MRWPALALILATSLCTAESHCPDPRLRQAAIGGGTIAGSVMLHKGPLKFAQVRLYFSSGKTAWVGTTDNNGRCAITRMLPGNYRLDISGWGSTTIQLSPKLDKLSNGQIPTWDLSLIDNACVGAVMSVD